MKALFTGGIKSGKSRLAEAFMLENFAYSKPYYLATAELIDGEMKDRIFIHRQRRKDHFMTIEEPIKLLDTLNSCVAPVLIECISMWINNGLYYGIPDAAILQELESVLQLSTDIVFVNNEVGLGVIPDNPLARRFVDLSGKAAQMMGEYCDKVYFCSCGIKLQMK